MYDIGTARVYIEDTWEFNDIVMVVETLDKSKKIQAIWTPSEARGFAKKLLDAADEAESYEE